MGAAAPNVDILINGKEIPDSDFISYVVERDMFQPDMAVVVLTNQNDVYSSQITVGMPIEIRVGNPPKMIYKGELIGAEGTYKGGQTTRLTLRAMNKMHRLLRIRKSLTFTDKTDKQIISQVAQDAGLSVEWKHEKSITYKHVYQHNLSGLEFIRTRAARMGCHVWCEDTKLFVKEPDLGQSSGVKLSVDKEGNLRSFNPRISTASIVNKVTVKGWNPETKELITGEAQAQNSPLGSENAVAASKDHVNEGTFTVDHPIWSKEEADAIAKARLRDLNLTFITGEAEIKGNAEVEMGKTVEIEANAMGSSDPFNGKYYVAGITHRHTMPKSKEGGYVTIIKFMRDAWKK